MKSALPWDVSSEYEFKTARSGGPGGQNVNKLETKVEVRWDILNSALLPNPYRIKLLARLEGQLIQGASLLVTAQEKRTQKGNKTLAIKKLESIIHKALIEPKIRKPTPVPKSVIRHRKKEKSINAEKKKTRGRIRPNSFLDEQ